MSLYGYYFTVVEQQLIYFVNDIFYIFAVRAIYRRNIGFAELRTRPNSIFFYQHFPMKEMSPFGNEKSFRQIFVVKLRLKRSSEPIL